MELLTTKIIALTLLGALSLFFGLLPLRLRRYLNQGSKKRERITSCLLCFGGGVLLATVFIHMLPETREGFNGAFAMGYLSVGSDYPLAELVVCAGFFLIYIVEEFVHKMTRVAGADHRSSNHSHHHHHHNGHHHHHHHHRHNAHKLDTFDSEKPKRESGRCSVYSITEAVKKASVSNPPEAFTIKNKWAETGVDNPVFAGDPDAMSWNPALKDSIVTSSQVMPTTNQDTTELSTSATSAGGGGPELQSNGAATLGHLDHHGQDHTLGGHSNSSHGHANGDAGGHSHIEITKLFSKGFGSNLRSVIIVLALSIHSVFEGLAVGLQERMNDVWYLFGAIAAHKFVIAFCLGVKLLTSMSMGLMVIYMVVFALVTPLGIAIGIIITETASTDPGAHSVLVTILQGLAGGTILYVTFFEILERERARDGGRLLKVFCVCLGFIAMASVETIGGHSHGPPGQGNAGGHSHSHGHHGHFHGDHDGHDHSGHDHDFFMDTTPLMAEHAFDSTEGPLKFLPDIPHEDHSNHTAHDINNNNFKAVNADPDVLHSGHDHGPAISEGSLSGFHDHGANAPGVHPEGNLRGFHSHEDTGVHSGHGHEHKHDHEHHSHSH
ncbi:zinc transporter ZIP3-like isoform X1 [Macrobrachium rosenbergii]|uniref:zinc transporter ZIP3-like isoform X1 n=1 Tax=Macrobrachium rosenbergii TaxID=79674 RepID=UPI0034D4786F